MSKVTPISWPSCRLLTRTGVELAQSIFGLLKQTDPHRKVALDSEAKENTRKQVATVLQEANLSSELKVDALVTCLVQLLDKTYSHFIAAFEVVKHVLKEVRQCSFP